MGGNRERNWNSLNRWRLWLPAGLLSLVFVAYIFVSELGKNEEVLLPPSSSSTTIEQLRSALDILKRNSTLTTVELERIEKIFEEVNLKFDECEDKWDVMSGGSQIIDTQSDRKTEQQLRINITKILQDEEINMSMYWDDPEVFDEPENETLDEPDEAELANLVTLQNFKPNETLSDDQMAELDPNFDIPPQDYKKSRCRVKTISDRISITSSVSQGQSGSVLYASSQRPHIYSHLKERVHLAQIHS